MFSEWSSDMAFTYHKIYGTVKQFLLTTGRTVRWDYFTFKTHSTDGCALPGAVRTRRTRRSLLCYRIHETPARQTGENNKQKSYYTAGGRVNIIMKTMG